MVYTLYWYMMFVSPASGELLMVEVSVGVVGACCIGG